MIDLSIKNPTLLRLGGITLGQLNAIIGPISLCCNENTILSPGMLSRHYAPDTRIRLNATKFSKTESVLGFGPGAPTSAFNLSATGDLIEAAANLFNLMHKLNKSDIRQGFRLSGGLETRAEIRRVEWAEFQIICSQEAPGNLSTYFPGFYHC